MPDGFSRFQEPIPGQKLMKYFPKYERKTKRFQLPYISQSAGINILCSENPIHLLAHQGTTVWFGVQKQLLKTPFCGCLLINLLAAYLYTPQSEIPESVVLHPAILSDMRQKHRRYIPKM